MGFVSNSAKKSCYDALSCFNRSTPLEMLHTVRLETKLFVTPQELTILTFNRGTNTINL